NWQGLRWSSAGLCYLATDDTYPAANATQCFTKVKRFLAENMGTSGASRGWNIEALGYTMYPWGTVGPYGIAAKRLSGLDIREAAPAAVDHTLWTVYAAACRIQSRRPGTFGLRPDFSDDHPEHIGEGSYGLAFHYCPTALKPGLVSWYDRMVGIGGDRTFDNARAGTIYSILFHPGTAIAARDPSSIPEWRSAMLDTGGNGMFTFRDSYLDAGDVLAQVYGKLRGSAGHNGPDGLGFRIIGLGAPFAVGGGRYSSGNPYYRSQNSLYPVDPDGTLTVNNNPGTVVGTPMFDGKRGSVVLRAATTNLNVKAHTRRFLSDFSAESGARAVFVVSDTSDDGKYFQFCTLPANTIQTAGNTFTITAANGASLRGTVIHPATAVFATGERARGSAYPYLGTDHSNNRFIHSRSDDGDHLVVMTLVPAGGTHPAITGLRGSGANGSRSFSVGGTTYGIDGDRVSMSDVPTGLDVTRVQFDGSATGAAPFVIDLGGTSAATSGATWSADASTPGAQRTVLPLAVSDSAAGSWTGEVVIDEVVEPTIAR
ncbi:MAG TPA: hypothetical protein VEL07_05995, partial [Planctomycetota bacterium]|nr:hypothetical protein [Planctomycetota bacterium]